MKEISKKLKELRQLKGLTRQSAAAAVGANYTSYCNWEQGKCMPAAEQLSRIAAFYGLTIEALIGGGAAEVDELPKMYNMLSAEDKRIIDRLIFCLVKNG